MNKETLRALTLDILGAIDYDLQKEVILYLEEDGENFYLEEIENFIEKKLKELNLAG